jgi:hypothetical protein
MSLDFSKIILDVKQERELWSKHPEFGCFWSDLNNPRGLQLTPTIDPGKVWLDFVVDKYHSGIMGIAHGGVAVTILDGLMGWFLLSHLGRSGVTTKAVTEYYGPLHVGRTYRFQVTLVDGVEPSVKAIPLVGKVIDPDSGKELVKFRADFFLPNRIQAASILQTKLDPIMAKYFPE